jgi:uncharacterized protein (TIRG00374 family)
VSDRALQPEPSTAPVAIANGGGNGDTDEQEAMPATGLTRNRVIILVASIVIGIIGLYFLLPKLAGLNDTWDRINEGEPSWLAVAAGMEALSFAGYVWLFRTIFLREQSRINWREAYQITMAGVAATRLFAAAGAGGIALTAWALRRSGMERRKVAANMVAFIVVLYMVYVGAVVVTGLGLQLGVFHGAAPWGFTVIPAIIGGGLIVLVLAMTLIPADLERRLAARAAREDTGKLTALAKRVATVPATVSGGVRIAVQLAREKEVGLVGAIIWWGGDIGALWACFHAFGDPPPFAVVVLCYFLGMLGNILPLPGGVGGVDGGMIAAFVAFDVTGGLAVVSVLSYRAFAFWLPTVPGILAYLQLRKTVERWHEERSVERDAKKRAAA